eukprot:4442630-Pyramimonas_sp.AAC.1
MSRACWPLSAQVLKNAAAASPPLVFLDEDAAVLDALAWPTLSRHLERGLLGAAWPQGALGREVAARHPRCA